MEKIEISDLLKIPEYDKSFKKITDSSEEKGIFVEKFFENNELVMKKYTYENGKMYSSDKHPGLIFFTKDTFSNEKILTEIFYINGKIGRLRKPAIIEKYVDKHNNEKSMKCEIFALNGKVSDQNIFPAIKYYYRKDYRVKTIVHTKNGIVHNDNYPAYMSFGFNGVLKNKIYYKNGEKHNENGPAEVHYKIDGKVSKIEYYLNGKLSRDNGPASIAFLSKLIRKNDAYEVYYYKNGKKHNLNGPAYFEFNLSSKERLNKKYYIDDKIMDNELSFEVSKSLYINEVN